MNVKLTRRMLAAFLAAVMLLAMPDAVFAGTYPDVSKGAWYEEAAEYCAENGLMAGKEGKFDPKGTAKREECVQVLYNLSGSEEVAYESLFTDVKDGAWYAPAVVWAAENNIAAGMGDGLFGTGKKVLREQMVTFLYNYASFAGADVSASAELDDFADNGKVSSWALDAVKWAAGSGILSGREMADGTKLLAPKGELNRAELASVMMNFNKLANGFRFIIENDGPYLVHCSEGKDRAGLTAAILECLMGATYDEVLEDYAETYRNYFSVEDGAQRVLTEEEIEAVKAVIVANLKLSFGVDITADTDLAAAAVDYMKAIGMSDEEIAALKAKLSK